MSRIPCLSLLAFMLSACGATPNAQAFKDCGCKKGEICVDPDVAPTCYAVPAECGSAEPPTCEDAQGTLACLAAVCGGDTGQSEEPYSQCHDEEGDIYRFFYCA